MKNKKRVLKRIRAVIWLCPFIVSVLLLLSIGGCFDKPAVKAEISPVDKINHPSDVAVAPSKLPVAVPHEHDGLPCGAFICPITGATGTRPQSLSHPSTGPVSGTVMRSTTGSLSGEIQSCPHLVPGSVGNSSSTSSCPLSDREGSFTLGRIPFSNPTVMVKAHQPVLDGIAAALGKKSVYLVTAPDYKGVIQLLVDKKIDAAWVGTGDYVQAALAGIPVEPLVTPVREGKYFYHGAIICRKDREYKSLSDLKGKSVAFVEAGSASGYIFPKALFEHNGFRIPEDIVSREPGTVDFLKKHDTVTIAVYLGKYDAGAVYDKAIDNVFKNEPEKLKEMQVLALTDKIMSEPIIVRSDMDSAQKQRIKEAFLSLSFEQESMPAELGGLEGFKAVSPDMYKGVIEALGR
jgi:phosphonate transport system substrate-binding protein